MKKTFFWFLSLNPVEREVQDPKIKLLNSVRVSSIAVKGTMYM